MRNEDFIPEKEEHFITWANIFIKGLGDMISKIGIPSSEYQLLVSLNNDFLEKYRIAQTLTTRTPLAILSKNEALQLLKKTIRQDVNEFIRYNRAITDADRIKLNLPIYKKSRTPSEVAAVFPKYFVESYMTRHLRIHFQNTDGPKFPAGQIGVEIHWAILDEPPKNADELTNMSLAVRSPFTLTFYESQRGKKIYFALCWENTRGRRGPWSDIISTVIP
jgi:hypothetical protein